MENKLVICLVIISTFTLSCGQEQAKIKPTTWPTEFANIKIPHYSLPILHLTELEKDRITVDEYLDSLKFYNSTLATIAMDTSIPLQEKSFRSMAYKIERDKLYAKAYVNKLLATCGTISENAIEVEAYSGEKGIPGSFVIKYAKPVGFLQWNSSFDAKFYVRPRCSPGDVAGQPRGTGCLIGKDLFLTALHCFQAVPGGNLQYPFVNWEFPAKEELARMMHVTFNYQYIGKSKQLHNDTVSFAILKLIESNDTLDYAIVRLAPGAKGKKAGDFCGCLTPVPLNYSNGKDPVCVIQQYPLKAKEVGIGRLDTSDALHITYSDIDTDDGCSGSPIIKYSTGELEGIHIEGSCTRTSKDSNIAVKIQAIVARSKCFK